MWRPEGWEEPYKYDHEYHTDSYEGQAYEAGADAILEALTEKGIRTDSFRTNSNPIYLTNPRQKGVYVFIPEEKTLGDILIGVAKETNKEGNHG